MTLRRVLGLLLVLLVAAGGYTAWSAWQVKGDLEAARASAADLESGLRADDDGAIDRATQDVRRHAASAADQAGGAWWRGLTWLPVVGDDVEGVRALTTSLDALASDGIVPLVAAADLARDLPTGTGISLPTVKELSDPVAQAREAAATAAAEVENLDSTGYAGALRTEFDRYQRLVTRMASALEGAEQAAKVLPGMLGAEGPRNFLLVFQNNAEIRPTGGMPGSFARLRADKGRLVIRDQMGAVFGERGEPVLPLSDEEERVYGRQLGTYFQDANFTPHFPRAAELMAARWEEEMPGGVTLDGVISLDPVAMSYLLEGTGPLKAQDETLSSDNAVDLLLRDIYTKRDTVEQDLFFADVTQALFDAVNGELASPIAFVEGLARATREKRLLVASFEESERAVLAGTVVAGEFPGVGATADAGTPYVDVTFSDATASKLSYFLRYDAEVTARRCVGETQELNGSLVMHQTISPREAEALGDSVTGPGESGDLGEQLVFTRLYGPVDGSFDRLIVDGKTQEFEATVIDGRPVVTMLIALTSRQQVLVTWQMTTGEGQTGDGEVGVTPSVVPGNKDSVFASAC